MSFRSWIISLPCALTLLGCQASPLLMQKELSSAASQHDVIDAWNSACSAYQFRPCPEDAGELGCLETMSSMYLGDDFEAESELLMISIEGQICSTSKPATDLDDLLNSVLDDPAWYF